MICSHCGADNPREARTCGACGRPLSTLPPFREDDPAPTGRKRRRGGKLLLILLAVLVIAALAVFHRTVAEVFVRTFSSPEAYYQHVEKRAIDTLAARLGDAYADAFGADGKGRSIALTAELAPEIQGFEWLETVALRNQTHADFGKAAADLALEVNGEEILTAQFLSDAETTALRVPLLSRDALALEDAEGPADLLRALRAAGLTRAEVEELIKALLTAVVQPLDDVSRSRDVLAAEGVTQRCTLLTVTIDAEDAAEMRAAAADVLRKNDAAQALLKALSLDAEAAAEQLLPAIPDDSDAVLLLRVGFGGAVRGRELLLPDGSGMAFSMPISLMKRAAGLEWTLKTPDGDACTLSGLLHRTDGAMRAEADTGDGRLDLFTLEYSDLKLTGGAVAAADFTLEAGDDLEALVSRPMAARLLRGAKLSGSYTGGDERVLDCELLRQGDEALTAHITQTALAREAVDDLPDGALPRDKWLRTIQPLTAIGRLTKALQNAGMPQDVLRTVLKLLADQVFPDAA